MVSHAFSANYVVNVITLSKLLHYIFHV